MPEYVQIDNEEQSESLRQVLRTPASVVNFPLSDEDLDDLKTLERKYDQEKNCAGLAAPQIGIGKKMIVFAAPDDPEIRKFREDHNQFMDKTIWINATYASVGENKTEDMEACFSVKYLGGRVKRFDTISYEAYLPSGEKVEGQATGFLARLIQHEIDHTQGVLFIDKAESTFDLEEYRKARQAQMEDPPAEE